MADAGHNDHHDEGGGGGGFDPKAVVTALVVIFLALAVLGAVLFVLVLNQETARNFIFFLNGLEILLGIYLIFLLFKLYEYIQKFKHQSYDIHHFYESRYVPPKESTGPVNKLEMRFNKAKEHVMSTYKEEWKIGIIELDTILKDLLVQANYRGDTVGELLKSAESKGFRALQDAWEAHKVRNRVVHEGIKYDMRQDEATTALRRYTTAFKELGL